MGWCAQILGRVTVLHMGNGGSYEFRSVAGNDLNAEQAIRFCMGNDLDYAVRG